MPVFSCDDFEILHRDNLRESWMEWSNMIVIPIDLHEALPVVVTGVIFAMMVSIRFEIHDISIPDICEILRDIMLPREEKSSPVLERPCAQMHTRIGPKMWSPLHLTLEIPRPLMEGTGDMFRIPISFLYDCLTVTADIRDELDSCPIVYEHPTIVLLLERVVVSDFRYGSRMSDIPRSTSKEQFQFFLEDGFIEVDVRWEHTF